MDFSYIIVFRFYFWILGVVLLTTFLVYCSKVNLLWWKIECKLKMATWRGLRHLDWHPLPNRPKFKMAAFLIRTAKFFFAKSLLLLQVSIMESYTKFHQHKFFKPWIFDSLTWTSAVWPFLLLVPKITCFCSQEPVKWLEWLKTLWEFTSEPETAIQENHTTNVKKCSRMVS